jgi:hypothetical protein
MAIYGGGLWVVGGGRGNDLARSGYDLDVSAGLWAVLGGVCLSPAATLEHEVVSVLQGHLSTLPQCRMCGGWT